MNIFIVAASLVGFALFILLQAALLRAIVRLIVPNPHRATFARALAVSFGLCLLGSVYGAVLGVITAMTGELSVAGIVLALGTGVALRMFVMAKSFDLRMADVLMMEIVLWLGGALLGALLFLCVRAPYVVCGAVAIATFVWISAKLEKRRDAAFFRDASAALDRKPIRA